MALLLLLASAVTAWNGDSDVAETPPAGWTSWNTAGCRHLTEDYITATIDTLAASPLLALGFDRVGIDDCWQSCGAGVNGSFHSPQGTPLINHTEFPDMRGLVLHGITNKVAVGFYVNNCNCKEDTFTDQHFISSVYTHTTAYVHQMGFGGLKLDGCSQFRDTHLWASSINGTGREIMVEDCHNMGGPKVVSNITGELDCPMHMWRTGNDITPGSWESFLLILHNSRSSWRTSRSSPNQTAGRILTLCKLARSAHLKRTVPISAHGAFRPLL